MRQAPDSHRRLIQPSIRGDGLSIILLGIAAKGFSDGRISRS
jgi:hypothetical protein